MKKWNGIHDELSDVGSDALVLATGLSFTTEGEIRRRPGLTWLASLGAITLSAFRTPVSGAWLNTIDSVGAVKAYKMSTAATSTLATGYNVTNRASAAAIGPRMYWTNDFDRMKMWDGVSTALRDAGIAAPTNATGAVSSTGVGTVTAGVHLIRYRYVDSKSPQGSFRSNPATALSYTAAANLALNFTIGVSGPIYPSTDPKVDTIQVEMTLVDGSDYYVVTTVANTATTVQINISDTLLALNDLTSSYDDFGHEQPPAAACAFECRGYAFLCGFRDFTFSVGVTNMSATVTGTGFSTLWPGRLIRFGSETLAYEILSITSTTITLTAPYSGTTGTISATISPKSANLIYWSRQYAPEEYKALTRARDVLYGTGDKVVGGVDFGGDAWFFGQHSICRLVFTDDPANGETNPVPGFHGLWNARTLMPLDGVLYGWGPNGVWMISGGTPRWLSRSIDTTVASLMDLTKGDQAFASYDPTEKAITWHFVATGATTPQYGMRYEVATERWFLVQYRQGIDCACVVPDDYGRLRLAVSDSTNARTYYHSGATDGVPASSTGAYTGASLSTTTSINTVETLPTGTGTDLSALVFYRASTGETSVITSNTANNIVLATAMATAVTAGEVIYVGSIPCSFKTTWWLAGDLSVKSRPHLFLSLNPSATGSVRVKVYRDFQTTAHVWTQNDADTWPDGVTVVNNLDYLEVSLAGSATLTDGFVTLPMPADWGRAWRAEIIALSTLGTLRVADVKFDVPQPREKSDEEGE